MAVEWKRMFAFCGQCWEQRVIWVKGNVGYCLDCRPEWRPRSLTEIQPGHIDGSEGDGLCTDETPCGNCSRPDPPALIDGTGCAP